MTTRKALSAFLAFTLLLSSLLFSYPLGISAEGENRITAQTDASVTQGNYGYCYVYIDDASSLASLSVSVYYDPDKIAVVNSYNRIACYGYDSSITDGCVQYTYLFEGEGSSSKTSLFYFRYRVKDDAEIGGAFFDIVINEAYDSALEVLTISGSRTGFTINEKKQALSCRVYGTTYAYSSVNNEFAISYSLSTKKIAAGTVLIQYDSELFEVVEVAQGDFFNNKSFDVNADLNGAILISFSGTEYSSSNQLLNVRFKTIKNEETQSTVKMTVVEFYDLERNKVTCPELSTSVSVSFDPDYTGDAPSMSVSTQYVEPGIIVATVSLEKDSHLGAGDFVLKFDPSVLEYTSSLKGFSPDFFNVNDKNVAAGELKFSIISLNDITEASNVLVVLFNVKHACRGATTSMHIEGSCVSDSLTSPIVLHYPKTDIQIPPTNTNSQWQVITPASCEAVGYESRTCPICQNVEIREIKELGHDMKPVAAVEATCTATGMTAGEKCSRCQTTTCVEVPKIDHSHSRYSFDKTSHWSVCAVCGNDYGHTSHILEDNVCVCGLKNIRVHLTENLEAEYSVYKQTVTVKNDDACVVAYKDLVTGDYVLVDANGIADAYIFTAPEGIEELYIAVKGDYNADGKLTADDVTSLKNAILGRAEGYDTETYIYDINADGKVTALDLALINAAVKKKIILW